MKNNDESVKPHLSTLPWDSMFGLKDPILPISTRLILLLPSSCSVDSSWEDRSCWPQLIIWGPDVWSIICDLRAGLLFRLLKAA